MSEEPEAALKAGKRLELRYSNYVRVVEVHAVGRTRAGDRVMRVYQVRGGSVSKEPEGWKLMRLDRTFQPVVIDERSEAPRDGYKRGDKHMMNISAQL